MGEACLAPTKTGDQLFHALESDLHLNRSNPNEVNSRIAKDAFLMHPTSLSYMNRWACASFVRVNSYALKDYLAQTVHLLFTQRTVFLNLIS